MGPTCVGKTNISIKLVSNPKFKIISVDSCMIYKNMNIGTGKQSNFLLKKFKYHLINTHNPNEKYSARDFCEDSELIINQCKSEKKTPIFIGGSMMYFWFLKNYIIKKNINIKFLNIAIIPSDKYKLENEIENRLFNMMINGFIEEVYLLFKKKKINLNNNSINSIGYKDFWLFLNGKKSLKNSIRSIIKLTKNLSKKQLTWLKKWKKNIFFLENKDKKIFQRILELINK